MHRTNLIKVGIAIPFRSPGRSNNLGLQLHALTNLFFLWDHSSLPAKIIVSLSLQVYRQMSFKFVERFKQNARM